MFPDQEAAFKSARESTKRLSAQCTEAEAFLDRYKRHRLEEVQLPADPSVSLRSVLLEASACARLCQSLSQARAGNMPTVRLNELNGTIAALETAVGALNAVAQALEKDNRPLKLFRSGIIQSALTGDQYYDFGPLLSDIFQRIDALRNSPALIGVQTLNLHVETKYAESASEVARAVGLLRDKAEELVAEMQSRVKEISDEKDSFDAKREDVFAEWRSQKDALDDLVLAAESAKLSAEESQENAKGLLGQAESIKEMLDGVAASAQDSAREIGVFHGNVENIRAELESLREAADAGFDTQKGYILRVRELIVEAEGMVSGATTAGLAKAFDEERKMLSRGMGWAMFSFLIGIAFLFITTILLAAYVFEIPLELLGYNVGQLGQTPERGDEITLAGVLSRTVILLAPFWLTLFSSRRYRNLFDLRQQYTHKYSMAFSVDGFKQQAPAYAEQMAAWVFHIVSEPPVSMKTSRGMGDNPLPDIQAVVNDQIERFRILKPGRED